MGFLIYNSGMNYDYNFKPKCPPVGPNFQAPVLFNRTLIEAARGDEKGEEAPYKGKYRNTLVIYEASGAIYLFSSDGNYTFMGYGGEALTREEIEAMISAEVGAEATIREAEDEFIHGLMDSLATDLSDEASARRAADTSLSTRIDTTDGNLASEVSARVAADNALGDRIDVETTARENADADLQTQVTGLDNAIDTAVMTELVVEPNTSTTVVELDATKKNLKTSVTTTDNIPLPVASPTQAGVMNSATYDAVTENTANINALMSGAVAITGLAETPTQQALTDAWKEETGLTDLMNRAVIYDVTNTRLWTYYTNDSTWHGVAAAGGSVSISQFTNNSLGTIQGSTNVGQVFAENDGTGSVNGWDALSSSVADNTSKLATIESGAEVNVQADWDETDTEADDYIKNKPTIDTTLSTASPNAVQNSTITEEFEKAAYVGDTLSTPSNVAYVATANIQDKAVTSDKIDWTTTKAYRLDSLGTAITDGDDLNDYTTPGVYRTFSATNTNTLVNCPHTGSAIKLVVEKTTADNRYQQKIIANKTDCDTYIRRYAPNGWGSWCKVGWNWDSVPTYNATAASGFSTSIKVAVAGKIRILTGAVAGTIPGNTESIVATLPTEAVGSIIGTETTVACRGQNNTVVLVTLTTSGNIVVYPLTSGSIGWLRVSLSWLVS